MVYGKDNILDMDRLVDILQALEMFVQIQENGTIQSVSSSDDKKNNSSNESNITIDDFLKIDLRVGLITQAEEIEEADKLLKLNIDLDGESRTIFAGIKSAYKTNELIGRQVVVAANLAPRKMRFGVSEGMVLAAGPGGEDIFLLSVDEGAKPGMKIK